MRSLGLTLDDLEDTVEILPDCAAAVDVFLAMATQWRTGMAGATGLDYSAVPVVLRLYGVPAKDRADVFDDLRVMEAEALKVMGEQRG